MRYIEESSLRFAFEDEHIICKYDNSWFFCECFRKMQHTQAVDIICITSDTTWLIEVKNYRGGKPKGSTECTVVHLIQQVRDTLAGLAVAQTNANSDVASRDFAIEALRKRQWKVVFHIEDPNKWTKSYRAGIYTKLKGRIKPIDQNVIVMSTQSRSGSKRVPWQVSSMPEDAGVISHNYSECCECTSPNPLGL